MESIYTCHVDVKRKTQPKNGLREKEISALYWYALIQA
jgi:hypothetical protein